MRIIQICTSCSSVYDIAASTYHIMTRGDAAYCPACGHPNIKQKPVTTHASAVVHPVKIVKAGKKLEKQFADRGHAYGQKASKRRLAQLSLKVQPLEAFRQRIEEAGRVFVLADKCLERYDVFQLNKELWPTIGVGNAFRSYPDLDAIVLTDNDFIQKNLEKLQGWQDDGHSRYIFWRRGSDMKWRSEKTKHGIFVDIVTGKIVSKVTYILANTNVVYFDDADFFVSDLSIPMRADVRANAIFTAINIAFQLGAKEIIVLGADLCKTDEAKKYFKLLSAVGCRLLSCEPAPPLPTCQFEYVVKSQQPLYVQRLREQIQFSKKCFLMGAGASLNRVPLHILAGFPVIGCNSAFFRYPLMDALIFGDDGFKRKQGVDVQLWQQRRTEKPVLFWHNAPDNLEGFRHIVSWQHAEINPINDQPSYAQVPKLSIKRSIITSAINLAFWLGATEIYLLGVDLDNLAHFWDEDCEVAQAYGHNPNKFPGGQQIADFIVWQYEALRSRNILLATCNNGGLLQDCLPYVPLETAADPGGLNNNKCFGGKKKEEKK